MMLKDGAGNSGKDFMGLHGIVGTGSLGGINGASSGNAWWQSSVTKLSNDVNKSIGTRKNLQNGSTLISKGGKDMPDLALMDRDTFNDLDDELWAVRRITDAGMQDMGFPGLRYNGVLCIWTDNDNITSPARMTAAMFILNTKYLYLITHSNGWMNISEPIKAPDKAAIYTQIQCMGNLVCTQRARQLLFHVTTDA